MDFALGKPAPALRPCVARYSGACLEGLEPGTLQGLPSRFVTLILSLGGPIDIASMPDPRQSPGVFPAFAGGLHSMPATVRHSGTQHLVHVYLEPLGVRSLLGVPAAALASQVVDLADLLGPSAEELCERLRAAPSWSERFRRLDALLLRVLRDAPDPAAEVAWAWRALVSVHGNVSVAALSREVGWSRRHLGERFRAALGLTPKKAARVLRFEWACEQLASAPRRGLAELAQACGYHDQPHLTREWQALAGCTPTQWIARELPFVQDFRTEP